MKHKCHKQPRPPLHPSKPQYPTRVQGQSPSVESTLVCVCFVFDKHEKRSENKIVLDVMRPFRPVPSRQGRGAPKIESLKNSAT